MAWDGTAPGWTRGGGGSAGPAGARPANPAVTETRTNTNQGTTAIAVMRNSTQAGGRGREPAAGFNARPEFRSQAPNLGSKRLRSLCITRTARVGFAFASRFRSTLQLRRDHGPRRGGGSGGASARGSARLRSGEGPNGPALDPGRAGRALLHDGGRRALDADRPERRHLMGRAERAVPPLRLAQRRAPPRLACRPPRHLPQADALI